MSRIKHPVKTFRNLSHKGKAGALVTAGCLVLASGALAYFLLIAQGNTVASGNLGSGTTQVVTMTSTFGSGLVPGGTVPVTVSATNPGSASASVASVSHGAITTPADPTCAAYLSLGPNLDGPVVLGGSGGHSEVASYVLSMFDDGTDQGRCAGIAVSIPFSTP